MDQFNPPKFLLRFFKWFCKPDLHLFIEGDLLELYQERVEQQGKKKADRRFALDILLLFRPSMIKKLGFLNNLNSLDMFKHNLLISWRSFKKDKTTFLINLLGLSTGLAGALLIFLWVQDEWSMDKFHEKDAQLYQVMQKFGRANDISVGDWTPGPLAQALKAELPEVERAVSVKFAPEFFDGIISYEDQHIKATPQYVESEYFNIFSYPLIHGSKENILADKFNVVISEELALKVFSSTEEALGKTIEWTKKFGDIADNSGLFTISGVFKSIPINSSTRFDLIFNYEFYASANPNIRLWENDQASTFLVVKEGVDISALDKKITALISSNREWENEFFLTKYSSKYLYGAYENGIQSGGRIQYVQLFSLIAFLILLIACINFMNLSTAKASIRIKEIGVKKTMGASRQNLIIQFMQESLLVSFLSLSIATLLVIILLPQFNHIMGKALQFQVSLKLLAAFIGIAIFTGLLSSTYPALYLSSFNPIQVLQGKLKTSFGELWLRKGLVVFQFAISVVLIVSVLIIYQQMDFIQSKNLGYDRDNILSMKTEDVVQEKLEPFLSAVEALPEVINTTNSNSQLIGMENWTGGITWEGKDEEQAFVINTLITNYDFIETFDIQLTAGRSFSREFGTDTAKVIINEAAARGMGFDNPIGEKITFWHQEVEIVGLTEDFQYQSLYHPVGPCIFKLFDEDNNFGDRIWVKIKSGEEREVITRIAAIYEQFNPGHPFEYGFVDEAYQALYASESRIASLSKYFAGLAIIISCLGLFGLALFSVERRTKEISVRKILGATSLQVIGLLSSSYAKLVTVALLVALPISYWMTNSWLAGFAYRIELEWWFFVLAAVATTVLAWVSVSWQTIKAARLNPVNGLRSE